MHEAIRGGEITIRDEAERLIDVRLLTYDEVAETNEGPEAHAPGAFADIDPSAIVLRQDHMDPALGRGVAFEERDNAPYMTFRVDRTARGDDLLRGIADGTYKGVSVGESAERVIEYVRSGGRRIARVVRAGLVEVSATWRPAYQSAAVVAVRSQEDEMDEEATAVDTASQPDYTALASRLEALEERSRADAIVVPEPKDADLKTMVRTIHVERALADVVTTGNEGVMPDALVNEMVGIIDGARPFLASTRRLEAPNAGTSLVLPRITQRPLVDEQLTEKAEVASRATAIDTVSFDMRTFAGAGDLSIQLIRRSSPQFLDLWTELLAEAYADVTDDEAVDALLAVAAVNEGSATFAPLNGDISFGEAFANAQAISRRLFPDTLWVSTAAVADMIDAKTDGTNTPMFGSLNLNADANGGISGTVSGLRVVHVPALDDEAVDAIVGPSRGFAWAEDGTYTLSADVPAKAGRDVGLVGMVWFAPIYPAAFTTYNKTS